MHMWRHLHVEEVKLLLAAVRTDPGNSQLRRVHNMVTAYLVLKMRLRTIEVSRARIEHFQELVLGEKRRD